MFWRVITQRFELLLCGVAVVDLRNGEQVGMLKLTTCQQLYDVQFLPGVQRPIVLNRELKEIRQAFTAPDLNY